MSAQSSEQLRVLLVEDDPDDARSTAALLSAAGALVVPVRTAEDALGRLDQGVAIDVVLLDFRLPGLSGVDAVRALRERVEAGTPVVVLTGSEDVDLARLAIAVGAQDVLLKNSTDARTLARAIAFAQERQGVIARSARERATAVHANLAKTRLLADASHEIRTPLNTVLGTAELLSETDLSPEQARHVGTLQRAGARLQVLVDGMLDLPRIEAGGLALEKRSRAPLTDVPSISASPTGELASLRVLVVDDSDESRAIITAYLGPSGARVALAVDAHSALERLAREPFDVVLMDQRLPGMDGIAATLALRRAEAERGASPVPIVALSGDVLPETIEAALAAGCDEYLAKPVGKTALLETLRRYAARKQALAPACPTRSQTATALLPKFLGHRERDVLTLREALVRLDFDPIATIGHNMRGNGVSYGFPEVSVIGQRLEDAATAKNAQTVGEQIAHLEACLERVRAEAGPAASSLRRPSSKTRVRAAGPSTPSRKAAKT